MEDWIQGSHVTSKFQNTQPWCVFVVFSSCTSLLFVGMGVAVFSFPRTWETREYTKLEKGKNPSFRKLSFAFREGWERK